MPRPPNYEFQECWNKQRENGHEFLQDKADVNDALLSVQVRNPGQDSTVDKEVRSRSARQLSWIYLLKFQQIANSLAWMTSSIIYILRIANRRIRSSPDSAPPDSAHSKLYRVIKAFLILVIFLFCFELVAYFKGWHFSPPSAASAKRIVELVYAKWLEVRADYLAPPLRNLANTCIVLFLVQSVDRAALVLGCAWIKLRKLKPTAMIEYTVGVEAENVEDYPMVLVQIPMCNEREVSIRRFLNQFPRD